MLKFERPLSLPAALSENGWMSGNSVDLMASDLGLHCLLLPHGLSKYLGQIM